MFNNNRSEAIAPTKADDKVRDIKEELANLGSIKEDLVAEIALKEKLASDYKDIDKKVEEAEAELKRLNQEIAKANHLKSDLEIVENKLNETKEFNDTISFQTKELLAKHDKLSADIKILEDSYTHNKVEFDSALLAYKKEIAKYEKSLADITEKTKKAFEEHGVIVTKYKEEINELVKTVNQLEQVKDGWDKKIVEANSKLQSLEKEIKTADNKAMELISNAELYCERIKKDADELVAKKKQELIDREGILSERESWLNEKEQILKETKLELEKFYGRKINNVII
ncbi:MAG TPA: hypothetical protein PKK32_00830 [Candidatus Paceibacterota bacterium]|nr:hypothetical protein [Candidatus Paceibacterota bacterium]